MSNVAPLRIVDEEKEAQRADMLRMVDELRQRIADGTTIAVGLVETRTGGCWSTEFSQTCDCRIDAGMLLELAVRRLGFASK